MNYINTSDIVLCYISFRNITIYIKILRYHPALLQMMLFIAPQWAGQSYLCVKPLWQANIIPHTFCFLAEIYTVSGFKEHTLQPKQFFGQKWPTRYVHYQFYTLYNTIILLDIIFSSVSWQLLWPSHVPSFVCNVGYDMSTFIRRYSRYLNEKAVSYRQVAFDFTKVKRG